MAADSNSPDELEVLDYPACPGSTAKEWTGWMEAGDEGIANVQGRAGKARGETAGAASASEAESARQSYEGGRARGREEGRAAEREAHAAAMVLEAEQQKRQLGALVARFAEESERYLREVEREVVKLALAVASRILRREAQMDPLLLTGAVRVALGQLAASCEVKLTVPAAELELWREAIAHLPHIAMKPQVTAREGMRLGDCTIESQVGTVDLGVRAQLAEIERGFFDHVGAEPAGASAAPAEMAAPHAPGTRA